MHIVSDDMDHPDEAETRGRSPERLSGLIAYPAIAGVSAALWVCLFRGLKQLF